MVWHRLTELLVQSSFSQGREGGCDGLRPVQQPVVRGQFPLGLDIRGRDQAVKVQVGADWRARLKWELASFLFSYFVAGADTPSAAATQQVTTLVKKN